MSFIVAAAVDSGRWRTGQEDIHLSSRVDSYLWNGKRNKVDNGIVEGIRRNAFHLLRPILYLLVLHCKFEKLTGKREALTFSEVGE